MVLKKFFGIIGMLSLICFSFFFSEKTVSVVKEQDDIMKQIREVSDLYKKNPIEAIVTEDTFIPGKSGMEVDINKSYQAMRKIGSFSEGLLQFKTIFPKETLHNNYHKYIIGGNPEKKQVSLIFLINKNTKIDSLVSTLDSQQVGANFFLDGLWLEKNQDIVPKLLEKNHNLGNLSYQMDYTDSSFIWMNTIIKKVMRQRQSYCYVEEKNKETLDICTLQKNYTILPNLIYDKGISDIKENIKNGSIISFPYSKKMEKELPVLINWIKQKGYEIVTLNTLLKED